MAVYKCKICGHVFDEEREGRQFDDLEICPVCGQPVSTVFEPVEKPTHMPYAPSVPGELDYDPAFVRQDSDSRYMDEIHRMAVTGKKIDGAMGTRMPMPGWDDLLLLGAQLNPPPLNDGDPVVTRTVIGKHARQPMVLESPIFISHMSFGALSKEIKIALAKGSAMAKTAMCSGEGGVLPEEKANAYRYIFEYIPNKYSVTSIGLTLTLFDRLLPAYSSWSAIEIGSASELI